jgi:hypothetical protein
MTAPQLEQHYKNRNPAKAHKTDFKILERAPDHQRNIVGRGLQSPNLDKIRAAGFGSPQALGSSGLGSIIDLINNSKDNPVYSMDVIEQVRWGMLGPQTPASINANFGAEIDLFGSGKSVQGIDFVETTMAQTGQTQTFFIACYIGLHMETEPMQWDTIGNAWTHPETLTSAPPSPDSWAANDLIVAGGLGFTPETGLFAGQTFLPAVLRHGWWANYAAWHLVRGYNLRWKIGQHTNIMDEVARHTAYMPPNAQEGSASDSEVDIINFVLEMNKRYDLLGSALNFLPVDVLRIGIQGALGVPLYTPTRDFDRVGATFGGMDLRSMLRGNSEFRKLTLPYVIKPGVPIGLILQENDTDQGNQMRNALDITEGQGFAIPPSFTADPNVSTQSTAFTERTVDALNFTQPGVVTNRVVFKSGDFKISLMVKGFEVTEDWYQIMSANADIREVVMSACGIRFAMQGGA